MAESAGVDETVVVIDSGSGLLKAGFSGEDAPRAVIPSVVGSSKAKETVDARGSRVETRQFYAGAEAQQKREILSLRYPIERGEITDWDTMQKLWEHTFKAELGLDFGASDKVPVLMSDMPLASRKSREKMAQIMFETFGVSGFYVYTDAVLSLFSSGRTRGVVVESGHGVTHCVPVFEGYALPHGIIRSNFAGQNMTDIFAREAFKTGSAAYSPEILRDMKEKLCSVSDDYKRAFTRAKEVPYELPDGTVINIPGQAALKTAESLFNPSVLEGAEHSSISSLTLSAINKCDDDLQNDLYNTIVLAGGTSMLPGFADRLQKEVRAEAPPEKSVSVQPDSQRKYAAWIGGSMLASLSTFQQIQITKHDYDESGTNKEAVIHKKCF